ncbi:MAG: hypothetical protein WB297_17460 [Actinomycetota bacterium]
MLLLAAIMLLGGVVVGGRVSQASGAETAKILDFDTMVGVPRPYTGATNAIRDVPGGGLPWVVDSAKGKLRADGRIDVTVNGLVIDPNDSAAIAAGVAGTNPSPTFKAIVSCLSKDAAGNANTVNVSTALFPASQAGDSTISGTISLPQPCIAPIVFVTSPGGSWFAASGF